MDTDLRAQLIGSFRWLDPGPRSTHLVSDRSGWWRDPGILSRLGPALAALHPGARATLVVAPEVTGFLLGPLVATALGVGFVEAYKDDRDRQVVDPMAWGRAATDYRGRSPGLGVRVSRVGRGDRALIVDDWIATGAQLGAVKSAIEAAGAEAVGAAVIVDCGDDTARKALGIRSLLRDSDLPAG